MRLSSKSSVPTDVFADEIIDESADDPTLKTSPDAIDARRAHQLLERAASLAARGDLGAAVLATRQSLALSPASVDGHLSLARLLERNRDFGGARAAYEKSVKLAPDHADANANLARLEAYLQQSQDSARQFQFDSQELFAPDAENFREGQTQSRNDLNSGVNPEIPAPSVVAAPAEDVARGMFDESMSSSIEARLPPSREEISSELAAPAGERRGETPANLVAQSPARAGERRRNNVPVATERRRVAAVVPVPLRAAPVVATGAMPVAATAATRAADNIFELDPDVQMSATPSATPHKALNLNLPVAPALPVWQQFVARPSFYARTLPVVGVALLSLGFLSWARGRAVSQVATSAPTQLAQAELPASAQTTTTQNATAPSTNTPGATNNAANSGATTPNLDSNGFPISNAPFTFPATKANGSAPNAPATNGAANNTTSTTARASNRNINSGASTPRLPRRVSSTSRPVPRFPGVTLAPAPIPPASVLRTIPRGNAGQNGSGSIVLPSPSVDLPSAPVQRQRALPPSDNGLNPAGSPGRGYVRVTEGRVGNGVIPAQPSGVARQNESSASDAARNGQTDQAISQLSQAIRADSDNAGFRYQQRATLFLQRGDYSRASDDFQSAISAYQTQIGNGNDVAQARRGLNSARSGLNLALAGKRN